MPSVRGKLRELFGIDLRSLALFRVGLGVCVLADLGTRARDLVGLYTDHGALPRDVLLAMQGRHVYLSAYYWASAHPLLQAALFGMSGALAVALLVGWRTRLANLACWYLLSSLQVRQPLAYIAGDSILRLLLFWGLFLPLGARFSVDASRGPIRARPDHHLSGATAALLLQVCLIYWATGLQKTGPLWWSGQAVSYALQADEWATSLGVRLRDVPWLLRWLNDATLAVELLGPLLAFVPVYTAAFRVACVALFWTFHAGLAAFMHIGLFPLFSMVAWLPFVPTQAWRWVRSTPTAQGEDVSDVRSRLTSVAALAIFAYIFVLLAERVSMVPRVLPDSMRSVGRVLRVQQAWSMFAPDPPLFSASHELHLTLSDGSQLTAPVATSIRWTVYMYRFRAAPPAGDSRADSLRRLANYHCAQRNKGPEHSRRADHIAIVARVRRLGPDAPTAASVRTLAEVACPNGHP